MRKEERLTTYCVIGNEEFSKQIDIFARQLSKRDCIVMNPRKLQGLPCHRGRKLDEIVEEIIDTSDVVFVTNPYFAINERTQNYIDYALAKDKDVQYLKT